MQQEGPYTEQSDAEDESEESSPARTARFFGSEEINVGFDDFGDGSSRAESLMRHVNTLSIGSNPDSILNIMGHAFSAYVLGYNNLQLPDRWNIRPGWLSDTNFSRPNSSCAEIEGLKTSISTS